jgi:hypothetical protein
LKNYGLAILGSVLFVSVLGYTLFQSRIMAIPAEEIVPPTVDAVNGAVNDATYTNRSEVTVHSVRLNNSPAQAAPQMQSGCPSDAELMEMLEAEGVAIPEEIRAQVNASSLPALESPLPYSLHRPTSTAILVGINGQSCSLGGTPASEFENATYIGGPLDNRGDNHGDNQGTDQGEGRQADNN